MQPADTAAAIASTGIRQKLDNLRLEAKKCYIYKVHDHLRNLNSSAYEPQILAIGPYHYGKENTMLMENHKLLYLKSLLRDRSVDPFVSAIEDIKQEALSSYADNMKNCNPAEFADMMLLDGCFIIELLQKYRHGSWTPDDPIFETEWMLSSIKRDLMLFENQIPFFVLCKLFNLVGDSGSNYQMLLDLIFEFFKGILPGAGCTMPTNTRMTNANHDIMHLLHLVHVFWSPDSSDTSHEKPVDKNPPVDDKNPPVDKNPWLFVSAVTKLICPPASLDESPKELVDIKTWRFVSAVTKLRDANVEFEKNDGEASLFNITFKNGTLKLSHLQIDDATEAVFRNLIAYEQYLSKREPHRIVTHYVTFLDCLIDSPGDVEILRQHGILENWLGSDKVVSNIFNKLTDSVTISGNFIYAGVCDDMDKYCKKRYNKWMAMLRRNHLRSPWAILSLIGAVVLLLLTAVQTLCSVLQL